MISKVCRSIRNWFEVRKHTGCFEISGRELYKIEAGGRVPMTGVLKANEYFRIVGSLFNDGVYIFGRTVFEQDESFEGAVWEMAPPADFLTLVKEIEEYDSSDAAKPSPYVTESFGGYSYTKVSDYRGGTCSGWESVFRGKLSPYRKI